MLCIQRAESGTSQVHGYSLLRTQLNTDYFHDIFDETAKFDIELEGHRRRSVVLMVHRLTRMRQIRKLGPVYTKRHSRIPLRKGWLITLSYLNSQLRASV